MPPGQNFDPKSMVLGAILAVATSLVVKLWEFWITDRRTKTRLVMLLKSELRSICETIDRLRTDSATHINIIRLFEINALRQGYDRNGDWVVIFKEEQYKSDITAWYKDLTVTCAESQAIESNNPVSGETNEFVDGERRRLIQKFGDLANKGRHLLEQIDKQ